MRVFSIFIAILLFSFPALAQDGESIENIIINKAQNSLSSDVSNAVHGIALHGDIKYPADFKHLDYVNPDAPKGGFLKMATSRGFDSLNPFIVKGSSAPGLGLFVYESLMEKSRDEPFSVYGLLAESVELGKDKSYVAFNIRKEAKWSDGVPVTANDVVWSFNALIEKGTPHYRAYYKDVKNVYADNEKRVVFEFKNNKNTELHMIIAQMPVLPKHFWEKKGRDFGDVITEAPLGSGPYKVNNIRIGQSIEYVRDENWWGKNLPVNKGRYNFDKIRYDVYREDNVALEAFFAGEYDVRFENVAKLWAKAYDVPPVEKGDIIRQAIPHKNPAGMQAFVYNTRRPVFSDINVRKALLYAFDFEWANKQFAFGTYIRNDSYFENSELASSGLPEGRELEILEKFKGRIPDEVFNTVYKPPVNDGTGNNRANLRKARKILNDAGYVMNEDGILENKNTGVKLEFEIVDNNQAFERWVMPFIQNLKKIGVKANFRVVDSAQYQNRMNNFDFDMTILTFPQSDSPGNEQRNYWSSEKANQIGSNNYTGIANKAVDELVEMVINAPNRKELIYRTRALDRVLLHYHLVIPQWHYNAWRIAWWKKLHHPKKLGDHDPGVEDTWWISKSPDGDN